ncbi:serine/threonine protein kinase [Pontibacillus yanchengensis]|uniref:Serine/threonine protein kinase n=2 Tax=Pontibacillus yanchengensis TaxID=462910 RepID=A0ACC7VHM6_9BACI|nr:serine/threonine protein kinase [Pontibacillus yanchengensis]MYL53689.1 serine/threonine protein kinase [Pontibacillus yanchengensis]
MKNKWESAFSSLSQITVSSNDNNEPVTIQSVPEDIKCIGIGTDAAVFQSVDEPLYAYKLYARDKVSKLKVEEEIYKRLGNSNFFSWCYDSYDNLLVLQYEEGLTLFDCLLQGIHIPKQVVNDVEEAREYVREKGLNPRDIHLKNILLQNGRAKIIDVSEYVQPGDDFRWNHLKRAYEEYYHLVDEKCVPFWVVETVRKWYNQSKKTTSFEEFMKVVLKLTTFTKH